VAYHIDGQGPGLVLVHGTGGDSKSNWGHLVERFAASWTVVRPDYAGSGATLDAQEPLSAAALAAQVVAAAKAAGAVPFDLIGFSLGAGIAAYIAAEYPDLVRSIVLLAGFATGEDSRLKLQFELWRDLIRSDRWSLARLVLLTGFSPDFLSGLSPQQIEENVRSIVADNQWEGMARQVELNLILDVSGQVKRIAKPTLVIGCTHDHIVRPADARAMAAMIPGARYTELDSGHLAPLECPDEFVRLVTDFLRAGAR
jgi:3-oxoadipate enol-lactonase